MKIKELINHLETRFPLYWQEEFDNCGTQCGDKEREITNLLVCYDMSEKVVDEAIAKGANMIISHHPIIYKTGLKKIEPINRIGKVICKAIENKIFLYSMHTNIDSGIGGGNVLFAEKLGLKKLSVLAPQSEFLQKLIVFVPSDDANTLKTALFGAGCGHIGNYSHCSYTVEGYGTFKPLQGSNPYIGQVNDIETVEEDRIEVVFPSRIQKKVIEVLYKNHPYEEPAFDIVRLENISRKVGLGRIGYLHSPMETEQFLKFAKETLQLNMIKYSGKIDKKIECVAVCGGGGAGYVAQALAAGADIFLTGDLKYHDFFIPENKMIVADIGHFEGEHFIREIIYNELKENFSTFAAFISESEKLEIKYI